MPDQIAERTLDPTRRRRQQAREQGRVARSRDLASAVLLLVGLGALIVGGEGLVRFLSVYTAEQLGGAAWLATDVATMKSHFGGVLRGLARHLLPLFGLLMVGAAAAHLVQTGFLFLPDKAAPDFARLDPIRGLRRLFSLEGTSRLGWGLLKILVIGAVAWFDLSARRDALLGLGTASLPAIASFASSVLLWTSLKIGVALLALGVFDYGLRRWRHERELRMTPQEMREEMRLLEGDPAIRARRRRVQEQGSADRAIHAVSQATVVLAAGDGPAVALRYDPASTAVPTVIAKGDGATAERMRQLAGRHKIPVLDEGRLARTLHRDVAAGRPIPSEHYAAVARILAGLSPCRGGELPGAA
ncbi:MAG TPA: EscU/YscU/HrcU family type III secretion system export apparatus switch protein [Thermoguttaceae bacterium]|nr:EscU/YscU/HrcU family type III secretion system export apparatus switch protein [Thermoguttaceae bacterium]